MSIEEKEPALLPISVGVKSDQVAKLHPFKAEAEQESRAEPGELPVAFIPALFVSSVRSKP